ncbi:hypothetical protein GJ496_004038 [Pomphorhynchus laevis]|nr:hypothetical protein GJ496_004038 [Pomphorhynchus laevis]
MDNTTKSKFDSTASSDSDESHEVLREWRMFLKDVDDGRSSSSSPEIPQKSAHEPNTYFTQALIDSRQCNSSLQSIESIDDNEISDIQLRYYSEQYFRLKREYREGLSEQEFQQFFQLSRLSKSEIDKLSRLVCHRKHAGQSTSKNVNNDHNNYRSLAEFIAMMHLIVLRLKNTLYVPQSLPNYLKPDAILERLSHAVFTAEPYHQQDPMRSYTGKKVDLESLASTVQTQLLLNNILKARLAYWTDEKRRLSQYRNELEHKFRSDQQHDQA